MSEKKSTTYEGSLGEGSGDERSKLEGERRWKTSPDALFRPLEDEAVILDMQSQRYFGLNPVGVRIWQLLEIHGEPEAIVAALLTEFEVDEQQLRFDVEGLIRELAQQELIEPLLIEPLPIEPLAE